MNIETWFGTFYKGERVEISETGLLREARVVKGLVREKRYSRGTEYLVIDGEDGHVYEVPLRGGNLDYIRRVESVNNNTPEGPMKPGDVSSGKSVETSSYQSKYNRTR